MDPSLNWGIRRRRMTVGVRKTHIALKNSKHGTKLEVAGNCDVDVGWVRSEPIEQCKTPTSMVLAGITHMKTKTEPATVPSDQNNLHEILTLRV